MKKFVVQIRDTSVRPARWRDSEWFETRSEAEAYIRELQRRDIGGRIEEGYQA